MSAGPLRTGLVDERLGADSRQHSHRLADVLMQRTMLQRNGVGGASAVYIVDRALPCVRRTHSGLASTALPEDGVRHTDLEKLCNTNEMAGEQSPSSRLGS